ncbi:MAG: tetratricopeptide repeat protein [Nitrospira sp.]|nr:tetratricopeptide repeat protein [Nitrospira sp.]
MSIIVDTLTRLQAERPRRPDEPRSSVPPDSEKADNFQDLDFFVPLIPSRALGNRLPALVVVLGCLGIAVYLWGPPFLAAPDKVMPKQEKVKAVQSAKPVPSGIVESIPEQREDLPVVTTTDKREDSDSTGPASVPDPPPASPDVGNARARKPGPPPGIQFTAKPPPTRHSHSASSSQRKNRGSSRLRNTTPFEIRLASAQSFIKQRQYAQAINILEPLFAKPPERWEPWFWLGTAQLGLGQLEKARALLVDGLARDATVPQLWVQRALVSQQQGRFGEALDALRQAELLAPKLPEVHLNLAYALEVEGNRLVAVKHYRTFLTLTEGKKAYHATRKKVLDRIGRLSKA